MPIDQNPILLKNKELVDPSPIPTRLQAVEAALATSSKRVEENINVAEKNAVAVDKATDIIVGAIGDATAARKTIALSKDTADLQAQNATIEVFEAGGGQGRQVSLMKTFREQSTREEDLLDERTALLTDDRNGDGKLGIFEIIRGQIKTIGTNQKIKAVREEQKQTVSEIRNITAATESFARVNALTKKTLNEGTIEANQKLIAASGRQAASETEIRNVQSNATAMNNLLAADARNVQNLLSVYRLEGEEAEREMQVTRLAHLKEQMAFQKKQWLIQAPAAKIALEQATLNLEESKALAPSKRIASEASFTQAVKDFNTQQATEDQLVEAVQRGQSAAGTVIEQRETILHGLRQSGEVGAKYDRLQEIGASPRPTLGATPFQAKKNLTTISPSGNTVRTASSDALDRITNKQVEKYKTSIVGVPKTEEELEADFNATAKEFFVTAEANIAAGDATNPYQAPPMSVLTEFKAVQDSPLYQKVLKQMEMQETNPQAIMDAAVNGVIAKEVSPEEAANGIELIFDIAALSNNTLQGGFSRFGLPNQTTYNTALNLPLSFLQQLSLSTGITSPEFVPSLAIRVVALPIAGLIESFQAPNTISVDLMDGTRVQEMMIKLLSASPAGEPNDTSDTSDTGGES